LLAALYVLATCSRHAAGQTLHSADSETWQNYMAAIDDMERRILALDPELSMLNPGARGLEDFTLSEVDAVDDGADIAGSRETSQLAFHCTGMAEHDVEGHCARAEHAGSP
jgi:hypothetical protein